VLPGRPTSLFLNMFAVFSQAALVWAARAQGKPALARILRSDGWTGERTAQHRA